MATMLAFTALFDPMFWLIVGPFMALAAWASWRVHATFAQMSEVPAFSNMTGAEVARDILVRNDLAHVRVEMAEAGHLSDHYDPNDKVVRLSEQVYNGRHLSALGVAAHEVGHALQDKDRYSMLVLRSNLVPLASFGSTFSGLAIMAGVLVMMFMSGLSGTFGWPLIVIGVGLFATTVLFQLVTLPVEFDASRRARAALVNDALIAPEEDAGVAKVLNAAALTYVAAALTGIATLVWYLIQLSSMRSEE